MTQLQLEQVNSQVYALITACGEHVGNLKRIGAVWKFKAVGYDSTGGVIPGGGPLTELHNTPFATPDIAGLNEKLSSALRG